MKILVVRLGAVGDIIRTLPVIIYLKDKLNIPVEIDWVVEKHNSNILFNHSYINEIIQIDRKNIVNEFKKLHLLKCFYLLKKEIKKIRKKKYDFVLDFHGIFKSGVISKLAKSKLNIGYTKKYSKEFNYLFNKIRFSAESLNVTRIEKNFVLINFFFKKIIIPQKFNLKLSFTNEDINYINSFFDDLPEKINIGINPAVSKIGKYKEWPEKYYSELIDLLNQKYNDKFNFIITWGPGEKEKAENIKKMSKTKKDIFLAPDTSLKQLAYLITKLKCLITGDTGPMHLANLNGIFTVALFGPSNAVINRPWGEFDIDYSLFFEPMSCSPCRNRKCKTLECQKKLTPTKVSENYISNLLKMMNLNE